MGSGECSGRGRRESVSKQLRALADARGDGYETICAPLTNDKWRKRWRELCLLDPDEDQDRLAEIEQRAQAWRSKPAFFRDELTVSRLGGSCASFIGTFS